MPEPRAFWFPQRVLRWESLSANGQVLTPRHDEPSVGFVPVYESIETVLSIYGPDCTPGCFTERVTEDHNEVP